MARLNFTEKEIKEIEKSMFLILDDIRSLWETAEIEEIYIHLDRLYKEGDSKVLVVNDKKIGLQSCSWDSSSFNLYEKQTRHGSKKRIKDNQEAFYFIKNYEETIRPAIESEIKKGLETKGLGFENLAKVKEQYDKEAEIVFDTGNTSNPPIIVLSEEEGKNIGTLYLGDRSLKIITNGPIRIINNTNSEELASVKTKRKSK